MASDRWPVTGNENPPGRLPLTFQRLEDFLGLGEPSNAQLGEDHFAFAAYLEGAAAPLDELDLDVVEMSAQSVRQTGGTGLVVSNDAVFDAYVHSISLTKSVYCRALC